MQRRGCITRLLCWTPPALWLLLPSTLFLFLSLSSRRLPCREPISAASHDPRARQAHRDDKLSTATRERSTDATTDSHTTENVRFAASRFSSDSYLFLIFTGALACHPSHCQPFFPKRECCLITKSTPRPYREAIAYITSCMYVCAPRQGSRYRNIDTVDSAERQ